jgi:hypothetical protein
LFYLIEDVTRRLSPCETLGELDRHGDGVFDCLADTQKARLVPGVNAAAGKTESEIECMRDWVFFDLFFSRRSICQRERLIASRGRADVDL